MLPLPIEHFMPGAAAVFALIAARRTPAFVKSPSANGAERPRTMPPERVIAAIAPHRPRRVIGAHYDSIPRERRKTYPTVAPRRGSEQTLSRIRPIAYTILSNARASYTANSLLEMRATHTSDRCARKFAAESRTR